MSEWRAEILRKRLSHILRELDHTTGARRLELVAEANLIWQDLQAAQLATVVA